MKIFILLTSFLLSVDSASVQAQCPIQYSIGTNVSNGFGFLWGQSFTATCSGKLEYVQFYSAGNGTQSAGTLKIYADSNVSGAPVYTEPFASFSVSTGAPVRITLAGDFYVVNQNHYAFEFLVDGANISGLWQWFPYPYSGGYSFQNSQPCYQHNFQVSILPYLGIENITGDNISLVYPNPTTDKVTILNNSSQPFQFSLYNSIGEKIIDKIFDDKTSTIDISSLSNNIYFYKLSNNNQITKTGKIVKQ